MSNILLVWPGYYSLHPPLGLLKLSAYHKARGDNVKLIHPFSKYNPRRTFKTWAVWHTVENFKPDEILITSLFTWAYREVHEAIFYCKRRWPGVLIKVGGVYASLMPEKLRELGVEVVVGVQPHLEDLTPDYGLVPEWPASLVFSSRGCIRNCKFCAVKTIEPEFIKQRDITCQLYSKHKEVYIQDNNFLASKYMENIIDQLVENNKPVDFNQSLDIRLFTEMRAKLIKKIRLVNNTIRFAFDDISLKDDFIRAVEIVRELKVANLIFVYALYNYKDSPEDFFERLKICTKLKIKYFPMRFEPLDGETKKSYVGEMWSVKTLRMVVEGKNRWGIHGSFSPPYTSLTKHLQLSRDFNDAFNTTKMKVGWTDEGDK